MAKLILVNSSSTIVRNLDSDRGDRENTYAQWTIAGGATLAIDEADIMVPFDKCIPNALAEGQVTTTESALDDIVDLGKKNFIASGLGLHYYNTGGALLKANRAVYATPATGNIDYPASSGGTVTGIVRQDGTGTTTYVRVQTSGSTTVELGGTVASGDYLGSDTTGRAIAVTATGAKSFGRAPSAGSAGETKTVTLSFKTL
jgi:hypothetical protein